MLPKEQDPTRIADWERRIRYFTLPTIWFFIFISGALGAYAGIRQDNCTVGLPDFDLLYDLSLSIIPACTVLLFYMLNLYGFLLQIDDWYRIGSTILHLLLYIYFSVLVFMASILMHRHLEVEYNDSDCLPLFDQKHQKNSIYSAVVLCTLAMSLIQLTPFSEYEK